MSINERALAVVLPLLPARILSFGYPEGLEKHLEGSTLHVVDLPEYDLNYPQDFGTYEVVLDPGTTEHVANVGQALRTSLGSVALDGYLVQIAPLTMFNHGYWAYTVPFLYDLYQANGFSIKTMQPFTLDMRVVETSLTERIVDPPAETWVLVCAHRITMREWNWPIQERWRR